MSSCPLAVEITKIAAGWIETKLTYNGKTYEFPCSTVWARDDFFFLIGVLFYFHPDHANSYTAEIEHFIEEFDQKNGSHIAKMIWGAEPAIMEWKIERELTDNLDFKLKIRCRSDFYNDDMSTIIETEVPYKSFCYNVIKEVDKAIKRYGFSGVELGTMSSFNFSLHHFLFLKGYVLDCMDLANAFYAGDRNETFSSFEKELELLQLTM